MDGTPLSCLASLITPIAKLVTPKANPKASSRCGHRFAHVCASSAIGVEGNMAIKQVLYLIAVILCGLAAAGVGGRITLGWAGIGLAIFTFGVLD